MVSMPTSDRVFGSLVHFEKEFGQVEGVVRAKKKPYIPVVLSRQEVDRLIDCLDYPLEKEAKSPLDS